MRKFQKFNTQMNFNVLQFRFLKFHNKGLDFATNFLNDIFYHESPRIPRPKHGFAFIKLYCGDICYIYLFYQKSIL